MTYHPSRRSILSAIIIMFLVISGVVYWSDINALSQVKATIETIDSIDPRLTSATIEFTINITNPTSTTINDLLSDYDMYIDDEFIGKGQFSKTTLNPKTSVFKTTNLTVYYTGLANATRAVFRNWVSDKESPLRINGTLEASTLFGLFTVSHKYTAAIQ